MEPPTIYVGKQYQRKPNPDTSLRDHAIHISKLESDELDLKKSTISQRQFLIKARNLRQLTQQQLADKMNVSVSLIRTWESKDEPIKGNYINILNRVLKVNYSKQEIL